MKKLILPLKENHLFSRAYTKGKCEVCRYVAVYLLRNFKRNPDGTPAKTKLGITVNRKLGKACRRNRVKRIIREAYRQNHEFVRDGYIMIIAARAAAFDKKVKTDDISHALRKIVSREDFYEFPKIPHNNSKKRS